MGGLWGFGGMQRQTLTSRMRELMIKVLFFATFWGSLAWAFNLTTEVSVMYGTG